MSWIKWLPLRFILRRAARSKGFLDPLELLARLRSLAQSSEVAEPIELLRAGLVFHARGLFNSRVIQQNLDWVWPYWVERQYDPRDIAFLPRAFAISHINLTHRNWTAIGYPDCEELPLVDPRGLLTPRFDGWSLDGWVVAEDGRRLLPSQANHCRQWQTMDTGLSVVTESREGNLTLTVESSVELEEGIPVCRLTLRAQADCPGWLMLALRPQNPEGVSFVHSVALSRSRTRWIVDDTQRIQTIEFSEAAILHRVSDYRHGDVLLHLDDREEQWGGRCEVDLLTALAGFALDIDNRREITVRIPLTPPDAGPLQEDAWRWLRAGCCRLQCPEPKLQQLYEAALTSLILHSPNDVYPGPYTYKRFWFRDAAFIIHALLCVGLTDRAARALDNFPSRQTALGYFLSQEGEWDANGEVLWILRRYRELTGAPLDDKWRKIIRRAARWIIRKRLSDHSDEPHAGLLPAGFSAEHFGPNDYYYWDDFWCLAGLRAAAWLLDDTDAAAARQFVDHAHQFEAAITRSLATCERRLRRPAIPASPYRRLDAGAIGSLVLGYPLQECPAADPQLLDTVAFLLDNCFVDNAFFQDMIHSGLNAYLTLHVAQVLLRAGDSRYLALLDAVAELASATGQWPEAIHPHTGGGCMGDGQHVWAAAEWVLMMRHCFVREEGKRLVLCAGVPARWLQSGETVSFGPAPTSFGPVSLVLTPLHDGRVKLDWQADWRQPPQAIDIALPGFAKMVVSGEEDPAVILNRE